MDCTSFTKTLVVHPPHTSIRRLRSPRHPRILSKWYSPKTEHVNQNENSEFHQTLHRKDRKFRGNPKSDHYIMIRNRFKRFWTNNVMQFHTGRLTSISP